MPIKFSQNCFTSFSGTQEEFESVMTKLHSLLKTHDFSNCNDISISNGDDFDYEITLNFE